MKTWDEFVAEVERGEAKRLDEGKGYDMAEGILRGLHARVAALEPQQPAEAEAPQAAEAPPAPAELRA